jgi:hypothetical protein
MLGVGLDGARRTAELDGRYLGNGHVEADTLVNASKNDGGGVKESSGPALVWGGNRQSNLVETQGTHQGLLPHVRWPGRASVGSAECRARLPGLCKSEGLPSLRFGADAGDIISGLRWRRTGVDGGVHRRLTFSAKPWPTASGSMGGRRITTRGRASGSIRE